MKEKWQQLSDKDRQLALSSLAIIAVIFCYFFLFRPLHNGIENLHEEVVQQQSLLTWMEPTAKQILNLRTHRVVESTHLALLPLLEQSLKSTDLNKQVGELSQTEASKVKINFKLVAFDKLIIWLDDIWKKYGIEADEINVTPKMPTGYVEATLVLTLSKE